MIHAKTLPHRVDQKGGKVHALQLLCRWAVESNEALCTIRTDRCCQSLGNNVSYKAVRMFTREDFNLSRICQSLKTKYRIFLQTMYHF